MVQDIRPEANALLRQISSLPQRKAVTVGNKINNPIINRESRVGGRESGLKTNAPINNTQAARSTHPKTPLAMSGRSVVEEVFNQIYSNSGFLEEQEVVPVRGEALGTRLDVYA